jgi:CBS domain-containing protein
MTIARMIADRSGEIISCPSSASVGDAVKLLAEKRIGALPVMDGGAVVGIFSERDVVYQLAAHGAAMLAKPVREVMTAPAITVEPGSGVLDALGLMTRRRIRHLPVVDNGQIKGFVSIGDLVKYRIDHIVAEAEAMRSYIQSA